MSNFVMANDDLFGRYCKIEMFRYGVPNEFYLHKIVGRISSNYYRDVPLKCGEKEKTHEVKRDSKHPFGLEDVLLVIQCGVSEDEVIRVPLKDVEILEPRTNMRDDYIEWVEQVDENKIRLSAYVETTHHGDKSINLSDVRDKIHNAIQNF